MKAKALNILRVTKNVLLAILISGAILEVFFRILLGNIVAIPDVWRMYNYALAVIALPTLLGIAFIPSKKSNDNISASRPQKPKKVRKNRRSLKIRIFGKYYSLRPFLFTLFGILCMLYCILSGPFHGIEQFNKIFRICTFLFIPVYPLVYYILSRTFYKIKKDSDYYFKGGDDVAEYLLGLFLGLIISILLGIIALILFGVYWMGKGAIWIIEFIHARKMEKFFGILSALVVFGSYPVYIVRIWQKKIIPNISSWIIFVLISVALCLSSFASGGRENSWVTFGPLLGCTVILISALIVSKEKSMTRFDVTCLVLACVSIFLWFFTRQTKEYAQYALYLGIFTDFMGILPSMHFLKKNPEKDRPGMWIIFSIGYFLSMFAITENTFTNWVLPTFMVFAPALVWFHLVKYRLKNNIPIKEWI